MIVLEIGLTSSIVLAIAGIIIACIFGFVPRVRKKELDILKKKLKQRDAELLSLYKDVYQLIQVEQHLLEVSGISKQEARKGYSISEKCEPKRVEKRIFQLEEQSK